MNVKRRISAWLLLLVYVPMMVVLSFHVHASDGSSVVDDCVQCAHHVHHGHLNALSDNAHDCVLCQFASLPFVAATAIVLTVAACACRIVYAKESDNLLLGVCNIKSTRAPPAFFSYQL